MRLTRPEVRSATNQYRSFLCAAVAVIFVTETNCVFCQVETQVSCFGLDNRHVPRLKRSVAGRQARHFLRRPAFYPVSDLVGLVTDKWHWGKFSVFSVSFIPPMLSTHFRVQVALNRRTNGPSLGTVKQRGRDLGGKVLSYCELFSGYPNNPVVLIYERYSWIGLMTNHFLWDGPLLRGCHTFDSWQFFQLKLSSDTASCLSLTL
jgi:hypothetical protein